MTARRRADRSTTRRQQQTQQTRRQRREETRHETRQQRMPGGTPDRTLDLTDTSQTQVVASMGIQPLSGVARRREIILDALEAILPRGGERLAQTREGRAVLAAVAGWEQPWKLILLRNRAIILDTGSDGPMTLVGESDQQGRFQAACSCGASSPGHLCEHLLLQVVVEYICSDAVAELRDAGLQSDRPVAPPRTSAASAAMGISDADLAAAPVVA